MNTPLCRRCLLGDMQDQRPLFQIIEDCLAGIAPQRRAPEALYAARLGQCGACDQLISGTCTLCGCYVELRAAKKAMGCPHVPPKW